MYQILHVPSLWCELALVANNGDGMKYRFIAKWEKNLEKVVHEPVKSLKILCMVEQYQLSLPRSLPKLSLSSQTISLLALDQLFVVVHPTATPCISTDLNTGLFLNFVLRI